MMMLHRFRPPRWGSPLAAGLAAVLAAAGPVFAQGVGGLADHRSRAIDVVLAAAQDDNPFFRANAIEALQPIPERARPLIQLGVDDPAPVVRFAALAAAGRMGMREIADGAVARLDDPNANVRAAAIYAADAAGVAVDPQPLAELLASSDPRVRANAVRIVSWMGDPGAVAMIKEATRAPLRRASAEERAITRVQVAEAVVRLGEERSIDAVRAAAYSPFDEVKVLAILTLGRLEDHAMAAALVPMLGLDDDRDSVPPIEVRLAAAHALGQLGQANGAEVALEALGQENPAIRAQAAFTLAAIEGVEQADAALVGLLGDESLQVRLSAAAGIIKRTSP